MAMAALMGSGVGVVAGLRHVLLGLSSGLRPCGCVSLSCPEGRERRDEGAAAVARLLLALLPLDFGQHVLTRHHPCARHCPVSLPLPIQQYALHVYTLWAVM